MANERDSLINQALERAAQLANVLAEADRREYSRRQVALGIANHTVEFTLGGLILAVGIGGLYTVLVRYVNGAEDPHGSDAHIDLQTAEALRQFQVEGGEFPIRPENLRFTGQEVTMNLTNFLPERSSSRILLRKFTVVGQDTLVYEVASSQAAQLDQLFPPYGLSPQRLGPIAIEGHDPHTLIAQGERMQSVAISTVQSNSDIDQGVLYNFLIAPVRGDNGQLILLAVGSSPFGGKGN